MGVLGSVCQGTGYFLCEGTAGAGRERAGRDEGVKVIERVTRLD